MQRTHRIVNVAALSDAELAHERMAAASAISREERALMLRGERVQSPEAGRYQRAVEESHRRCGLAQPACLAAITPGFAGGRNSWDVVREGDDAGARGRYSAEDLTAIAEDLVGLALEADHLGSIGYGPRVVALALRDSGGTTLHDLGALRAVGRFLGWLSGLEGDWPYSDAAEAA